MLNLPIIEHLLEIKWRFIYILYSFFFTFIINYIYIEEINFLILSQFIDTINYKSFIYTHLTEILYSYIKVSFICGLIINSIYIYYNILLFLLPGFYKREKDSLIKFCYGYFLYLFFSFVSLYYLILPLFYKTLITFGHLNNLDNGWELLFMSKLTELLTFHYFFLIGFFLIIHIPIFLFLLVYKYNNILWIITQKRIYIYFFIYFFLSLLTPPEFLIQFIIFSCFIVFWECTLFILYLITIYKL